MLIGITSNPKLINYLSSTNLLRNVGDFIDHAVNLQCCIKIGKSEKIILFGNLWAIDLIMLSSALCTPKSDAYPESQAVGQSQESSVVSGDTVPLYMRPLALCWLPALIISLVWLPLALHWLPITRFFITRAPNPVTRLEVDLQSLHRLPTLAPYTDSLHPVLPQEHRHQRSKGFPSDN